MDDVISLLMVLIAVAVLVSAIVIPIVALVLAVSSRKRISQIDARLDRIEATLAAHSIFPATPATADPQPRAQPPPTPAPEPETATAPPGPPPPVTPSQPALNAYQLESVIGRRWIGWIAISLILFATA